MSIKQFFGKKIKENRLKQNLTQEELAEKIGISPKSLSQIELGNNFVSAENLEAICTALDIQPGKLFDFESEVTSDVSEYVFDKLKNDKNLLNKIYKIIAIIE